MDLAVKGAEAPVQAFRMLTATMAWQSAVDLDLAVLAERKDGKAVMLYFGNIGKDDGQGFVQSLDDFPFILLSGDAGVGDSQDEGGNEEELKITSLVPYDRLHLLAWDYTAIVGRAAHGKEGDEDYLPAVAAGSGARFQASGVTLKVVDDQGHSHDVTLSLAGDGLATKENMCVIATIDNTNPSGAKIVNSSHAALFGGDSGRKLNVNDILKFVR